MLQRNSVIRIDRSGEAKAVRGHLTHCRLSPAAGALTALPMSYISRTRMEEAHEEGIWSVGWSSNGQVVTGSCDEVRHPATRTHPQCRRARPTPPQLVHTFTVRGNFEKKYELQGHHLGVTSVSVQGNLAASSALDSCIRLWDLERGSEVRMPPRIAPRRAAIASPRLRARRARRCSTAGSSGPHHRRWANRGVDAGLERRRAVRGVGLAGRQRQFVERCDGREARDAEGAKHSIA